MIKRFIYTAVVAAVALASTSANAQSYGGCQNGYCSVQSGCQGGACTVRQQAIARQPSTYRYQSAGYQTCCNRRSTGCGLFGRRTYYANSCTNVYQCQNTRAYEYAPGCNDLKRTTTCANGACKTGDCYGGSCSINASSYEENKNDNDDEVFVEETCGESSCTDSQNDVTSIDELEEETIHTNCSIGDNYPSCCNWKNVQETVAVAKINRARQNAGVAPLKSDPVLTKGAFAHCQYLARLGYLWHDPAAGSGEIIAMNTYSGIDYAIGQWLESHGKWRLFFGWTPGHAEILLNPNYTKCGAASYRDSYGRNWCTARFN